MKRSGTTNRFWWVPGTLNVLATAYPIVLVRRADSVDAHCVVRPAKTRSRRWTRHRPICWLHYICRVLAGKILGVMSISTCIKDESTEVQ